ncbi:ubiquilin-1-like [Rhineura floridana]|uniref:ubiquilin-1-like n=1 Tax=Rhineura floridana TaxID=261503 RepID=UPI002AC81D4B|nr:ubiquilin-1-like [Rhineura floridana]
MATMDKDPEGPTIACPIIASNSSFICVTAKSPKASAQFVLPEISTIQQFKEEISKHFNCETNQLVLVFFGRILKDQDTLRQCGIMDGMTVHLVIRSLKRDQEDPPQPPYVPRTMTHALIPSASSLTSPAFSPSSQGSWGLPDLNPTSTEWQVVPTSEMIIQKVRQVILANPEIQQLAQQVPAISHILNNMDIMRVILDKMREIMDLAKNPDMIQDLKAPDQALISLQGSIPGGDNPLRQLNSEIQEPGLSAVQDLFAFSNPYATLVRSPCPEHTGLGSQSSHMETPERMGTLPISHSSTSICTNSTCSDEGGIFSSLANPLGHSSSMPNLAPTAGAGMFGVGGIQNPDASEIPKLIVNLCNAYTKRMMFSLMQNALLASEGSGQASQQEQVQQLLLHFSQQMQSPEMVAAMSNPKAIQAWVQMEQGLQALVAEAPVLIPWFMLRLRGLGYSTGVSPWANDSPCQGSAALE